MAPKMGGTEFGGHVEFLPPTQISVLAHCWQLHPKSGEEASGTRL